MIEKLDINNVYEVQKMRQILKGQKDLLDLFDAMLNIINDRLNGSKRCSPENGSAGGADR